MSDNWTGPTACSRTSRRAIHSTIPGEEGSNIAHNATDSVALTFHEETKHSELSVRTSGHYLDWDNRPYPFKLYENLPVIPLPRDFPRPVKGAIDALASLSRGVSSEIDVHRIAELLFFSAGLTRKMNTRAGVHYMRAAPATGALYPIELYVISCDMAGLESGIYHFNPLEFGLVKLRKGDYTAAIAEAAGRMGHASRVTVVFTSLAWRNAWKYGARSYRHWFWDSGVIAANLLATCSAENISVKIDIGFDDSQVSRLLGLARGKEAPIALAHMGALREIVDPLGGLPPALSPAVRPLSREETDYPIVWKTNSESELHGPNAVRAWRETIVDENVTRRSTGAEFKLASLSEAALQTSLEKTILLRGSTRRFKPGPIPLDHLATILRSASSPIPLDTLAPDQSLTQIYFLANQVDGLPSGSYHYDPEGRAAEQLKAGRFRDISGYLCLDQSLFADTSAMLFLMTDLQAVINSLGDRGYRSVQFEAGIRAGRIYLSSYALGHGASGSTFYDDAVTDFFSPSATGLSTMLAVGVGDPAYKARPGKVLLSSQAS